MKIIVCVKLYLVVLILYILSGCSNEAKLHETIYNSTGSEFNFSIKQSDSTYDSLEDVVKDSNVIIKATVEEEDYTWTQTVNIARYKCSIVNEYTSNLDADSVNNGYFYLYDDNLEIGKTYILFLHGNYNYVYPHCVYVPIIELGLWGIETDENISVYYQKGVDNLVYTCNKDEFRKIVDEYSIDNQLEKNTFTSVEAAADYAEEIIIAEITDIKDGYNDYSKKYTFNIKMIPKNETGMDVTPDYQKLCPYKDDFKVGDTVMLMTVKKNNSRGYFFSYDYAFTNDKSLIQEVIEYLDSKQTK